MDGFDGKWAVEGKAWICNRARWMRVSDPMKGRLFFTVGSGTLVEGEDKPGEYQAQLGQRSCHNIVRPHIRGTIQFDELARLAQSP